MAEKNNISEIMETAIEEIRSMVDADTIIGNPIAAGEVTVIPVSKITFGIASGGVDLKNKNNASNFGGGGGSGVTVTPVGFLVVNQDGDVRFLSIGENSGFASGAVSDALAAIDGLVDKAPGYVDKLSSIFKKKSEGEDKDGSAPECKDADEE